MSDFKELNTTATHAEHCTGALGFALTPLNGKRPIRRAFNSVDRCITRSDEARDYYTSHPTHGMGIVHSHSGTCAADIDDLDKTSEVLAAVGINVKALLSDPKAVLIEGRQRRAKILCRVPIGASLRRVTIEDRRDGSMVIELRAGGVQDVLPPSIHPDTGEPYRWTHGVPKTRDAIPILSVLLCDLWLNWGDYAATIATVCPWAKVSGHATQERDPGASEPLVELDLPRNVARATKFLRETEPAVQGQRGDDRTFLTACRVKDIGISEGLCLELMVEHYNPRCVPPWDVDGLAARVRSAYRNGQENPGCSAPETLFPDGDQPDPVEGPPSIFLTDAGNARRLVDLHGQDLLYVAQMKRFLIYHDTRWQEDITNRTTKLALDVSKQLRIEAAKHPDREERTKLFAHSLKTESAKGLRDLLSIAASLVPCSPNELDQDPYMLNCLNGTLDLRTGALSAHRRQDRITKLISIPYDPTATAPRFQAFLNRILNQDPELIRWLQKALGYCLSGDTSEQSIFIFHGSGENGKSTLLETLREVVGDYGASTRPELLMAKSNPGQIPPELASLRGMRLVATTEGERNAKLSESLIKVITGGEQVTAKFLYSNPFSFTPTFKILFATNHLPQITGTDHAIWRRIKLVPFEVRISPKEKDPHLRDKLRAEFPGILAWMVEGFRLWQSEGLGDVPNAIAEATATYRNTEDRLSQFLTDCCEVNENNREQAGSLYAAYLKWRTDEGEIGAPLNQKAFGAELSARGFSKQRLKAGIWYQGIQLRGASP